MSERSIDRRGQGLTPSEVVSRAYRAAMRGRDAEANRWVAPALLGGLRKSHESMTASLAGMRALLATMDASPEKDALRLLLENLDGVVPLADGKQMWRNRRHGGEVAKVEIVRQTIRLKQAWVTVRLHLKDGSTVDEREVLRLTPEGWRIAAWVESRRRTMR